MSDQFIERKIIIGLITSTEYIKRIRGVYQTKLLSAAMAKRLGAWCIEYYDTYKKAPKKAILDIFMSKLKNGLPKDIAEEIEEEILPSLNEEFVQSKTDLDFLITQTIQYFNEKHLQVHVEKIQALIESGEVDAANSLANNFKPIGLKDDSTVNFSDTKALASVEKAFSEAQHPLIYYPKQLGEFWNHHLVRGGFVALLGPEKRGKTFWLMDMATRAVKQGNKVAFFQAGDMTESQQIRRFCIHLAKASDMERYIGKMLQPVPDCLFNQLNLCEKSERECSIGVFEDRYTEKDIRHSPTFDDLREAWLDNTAYSPCHNCKEYKTNRWGVPWLQEIEVKHALDVNKAKKVFEEHFIKKNRKLMLSSHANGSLSVSNIKTLLNQWQVQYDFVPDVIIIDYADLLVPDTHMEFRHQQNEIWKALRNLSQEERKGLQPLVITVTQADADSYDQNTLRLKNFSEDKRKYGHTTAMWGLNQDPQGREKKIGIMRINELVIREGESNVNNVVYVLQNLKRGLPYLGSYF